jgi:YVTN family beta-propeller protein
MSIFEEISLPMKTNRPLSKSLKPAVELFTSLALLPGLAILSSVHHLHAATPVAPHEFRIQKQWTLGGKGGWGLLSLDTASHQLYIPRNNRVMVVDAQTGTLLGEIGGMINVREMTLDDSGKYGYVTDPTDGTAGFVRVFDRSTRKLVTSVPTGRVPTAIVFDPATKSVFAFNSHSHSVTVIDSTTNEVIATIPLDGRPGSAVADGNGNIYVTLPALGEITRIDTAQKKVITSFPLMPCTGPAGLAIDNAHRQLFTTCENHKLIAVNADTGHVITIDGAAPSSGDIDFDTQHNILFLADGSGTLTILRRDSPVKYSIVQKITTQPGARTMIIDHNDDKAYLATAKYGMNTGAASEELQFRPTPVPDTFSIIVVGR